MSVVKAVLVLALGACTHGQLHHFNRIGTGLAVIVTGCDAGQTEYAATFHGPTHFVETNPMLGDSPSTPRVAGYFAAVIAGTVIAAHYLPDWATPVLAGIVTVVGIDSIWHNTVGGNGISVPISCGIENR